MPFICLTQSWGVRQTLTDSALRPMGSSAGKTRQQCHTRASVFFKNCPSLPRGQKNQNLAIYNPYTAEGWINTELSEKAEAAPLLSPSLEEKKQKTNQTPNWTERSNRGMNGSKHASYPRNALPGPQDRNEMGLVQQVSSKWPKKDLRILEHQRSPDSSLQL